MIRFLTLLPLVTALSSQASVQKQSTANKTVKAIEDAIRKSDNFQNLFLQWHKELGSDAVPLLKQVASHKKNTDTVRYVALMGMAKLGGKPVAEHIRPFLKDTAWMLRSGSIRALSAIEAKEEGSHLLPLAQDPALVVRLEAVHALKKLKPEGYLASLATTALDERNYQGKRSLGIAELAIDALSGAADEKGRTLYRDTLKQIAMRKYELKRRVL